jgi:hypothetical protein
MPGHLVGGSLRGPSDHKMLWSRAIVARAHERPPGGTAGVVSSQHASRDDDDEDDDEDNDDEDDEDNTAGRERGT